jgi:hypothetical protein
MCRLVPTSKSETKNTVNLTSQALVILGFKLMMPQKSLEAVET